ncbi:MAG: lipopolysaccharide kinase InaA family protein [Pseudomonadota bacterium]
MDNRGDLGLRGRLAALEPYTTKSFSLDVPLEHGGREVLNCRELLRCLPGKRLACVAEWRGETVFAKLFLDVQRARAHWQREEAGIRILGSRGILTPTLIHSGSVGDGVYLILYRYIPEGVTAATTWESSSDAERLGLIRRLAVLLAGHHGAGIVQRDLHLGNFLLADGLLYTLDGDGISAAAGPLGRRAALGNLALLLAQLPPCFDKYLDDILEQYIAAGSGVVTGTDSGVLRRLVGTKRERRKRNFLEKTMRECTAFVCWKAWGEVTVYDRTYDTEAMRRLLADPDAHVAVGEPLKKGNTCTVTRVEVGGRSLVVKRYNIKSRFHTLNRAFRPSRAAVSWRNAHRLLFYGIATPKPVALVEKRWGPLRQRAYFITEFVPGVDCLAYMLDGTVAPKRKSIVAEAIAEMLKNLHSLKISHGDLKGTNIRICDHRVMLIDLDSMRQHSHGAGFARAWRRDMRRFFKNWAHVKPVGALFEKLLVGFATASDKLDPPCSS